MSKEKKYPILDSEYFGEDYLKKQIDDEIERNRYSIFSDEEEKDDEKNKIQKIKDGLEEYFESIMHQQYMSDNVKDVFKKYGEENVVKFLKKIEEYRVKYEKVRIRTVVTEDEIEEFLNNIKNYKLRPTTEPLNAKTFLKLCRICYDAAPIRVYPEGISDYFIYKDERGSAFHEDSTVLDPKCYEDDEEFLKHYPFGAYHFEEIRFGGPCLNLKSSITLGDNLFETVRALTGSFYSKAYDGETCGRTIKMYNALRKNGYSITFDDPYETLNHYLGHIPDENRYGYKYFNTVEEAMKAIDSEEV